MRVALLLAILLLIPGAAAASPFELNADRTTAIATSGDLELRSAHGVLDLTASATSAWTIDILQGVGQKTTVRSHTDPLSNVTGGRSGERVTLPAGRLTGFTCEVQCLIALIADGPGSVGARSFGEAALEPAGSKAEYCGYWSCASEDLVYTSPEDALPLAFGGSRTATPIATGNVTLLMRNAIARFESAEGTRWLDARRTSEDSAPLGLSKEWASPYYQIRMEIAGLDAGSASPEFALRLVQPSLDLNGRLDLQHASGVIQYGARTIELHADDVQVDGRLAARPEFGEPLHNEPASSLLRAPASATASGDADQLVVNGELVAPPVAPIAREAAVGAIAILALVALIALAKSLGVSLYTRIAPGRALAHPERRRLHEILANGPPRSIAELARITTASRTTLVYHLRVLERQGHVVGSALGRERLYSPTGGPEAGWSDVERHPTRKRVLEAIPSTGALTQDEIAKNAGISLRLVSYHLSLLRAAGLVDVRRGSPRRYVRATPPMVATRENT